MKDMPAIPKNAQQRSVRRLPVDPDKVRILLADDHQIVLDGLRSLLEKHDGMTIVAEARDGRSAVRCAADLSPDIVLMDISMPGLNGIEAARQIIAGRASTRVLILSVHSDERFISRALEAGASGYMLKECAINEVIHAINTIRDGQRYLSPKICTIVIEDFIRHLSAAEPSGSPSLTPSEIETLQLLAEGKNTKEIAITLHVSGKAIEARRRRVMDKLGAGSVADLVKYAIREGLTTLE